MPGPDRFRSLPCDVTDPAQVEAAFAAVEEAWGPVEVLVANAGVTRDTLVLRMSEEAWSEVIDTNLTGVFRVTKRALTKMLRLHRGRVIMVSSVGAFIGSAGQANYAASKAGLVGMARSMAREVASRSITVNVVAPGLVETNMLAALGEERIGRVRGPGPPGSGGPARGDRRGRRLPGLGRSRLHHRSGAAGGRGPGHGAVTTGSGQRWPWRTGRTDGPAGSARRGPTGPVAEQDRRRAARAASAVKQGRRNATDSRTDQSMTTDKGADA